jgi:hypothetical protein
LRVLVERALLDWRALSVAVAIPARWYNGLVRGEVAIWSPEGASGLEDVDGIGLEPGSQAEALRLRFTSSKSLSRKTIRI